MGILSDDAKSNIQNHAEPDGVWQQVVNRAAGPVRRAALFLDRDGVLVEDVSYLHQIADAKLVQATVDTIHHANTRHIPVILVTNQGGIGLGKYNWSDFAMLQEWINAQLAEQDAFLSGVYACPFHPKGTGELKSKNHADRKPNPGMLHRAAAMFPIDLSQSWIVGDRDIDIQAGKSAGLDGGIIIPSEHSQSYGDRKAAADLATESYQVVVCEEREQLLGVLAPLWAAT